MKKFLVLSLITLFYLINAPQTQASSKIPNASFENWQQTSVGLRPNNWTLEYGTVKKVLTVSRASAGNYSVQLQNPSHLYSNPFDLTYDSKTNFKFSVITGGGQGKVKLLRRVDGINSVCTINLPNETNKTCLLDPTIHGHQFYVSISNSQSSPLLLDMVTLAQL